jgi:hypothetical protein
LTWQHKQKCCYIFIHAGSISKNVATFSSMLAWAGKQPMNNYQLAISNGRFLADVLEISKKARYTV